MKTILKIIFKILFKIENKIFNFKNFIQFHKVIFKIMFAILKKKKAYLQNTLNKVYLKYTRQGDNAGRSVKKSTNFTLSKFSDNFFFI